MIRGGALDRALDAAVVPGYSRLGYALRGLRWEDATASSLRGRRALVTGGTSGIGEAAAEGLLSAGASVHVLGRNGERVDEAIRRIGSRVRGGADRLHRETCDISDLAAVRRFGESFLARHERLDVLVNNAGVLSPSREHTPDCVELTFATNVLGPFLLTSLLLPALTAAPDARVITVSSGGMYTARLRARDLELRCEPYDGSRVYAHTKRIEVILSHLWAEHHGPDGIAFHSMHPGWVATPGLRSSLPGFERLMRPLLRSARQGADTIVWLATASPPRSSGAFWHDRVVRPEHRIPGSRESESERRLLWEGCERLSTLSPPAARTATAA